MDQHFPVTIEIPIRFGDIDALGHVNNARYLSYMEEARIAYMERIFPGNDFARNFLAFPFILGEVTCRYLSPAFLDETLEVGVRVGQMGTKSFTVEYLMTAKGSGRPVAKGQTTMVVFDLETQKSLPISDELRAKIREVEGRDIPSKQS